MSSIATKAGATTADWVDDRLGVASFMRKSLNKVFPDHWSFMIGEIALYSFVILLLTGTYLTFFYTPSTNELVYNGSYVPLKGVTVSEAYNSTLDISFDVRAGLVIRQIHHWAALLFLAAIIVHLCRIYFTGAFRKPREINWLIGVGLLVLGIVEGFAGYSLPDDLLSGTGLRIMFSIILSIPVVGSWLAVLVFNGEFPGNGAILDRLYVAHILLIPGILLALITAHMMILWHQKHTQFPGPGRTENNVVGERLYPTYALKGGGFFALVFAVVCALGGLAQINPVWLFGPYDPANVSDGSQPDWYMAFLDGALRLMPSWETRAFGHNISWNILTPSVILPGILFTGLALYPWIEHRLFHRGEHEIHNLLERPRDNPRRTALGVMALTFYMVLFLSSGNDIIANIFGLSVNQVMWAGRVLLFVTPPIGYAVAYRLARQLQRSDEERVHHGIETGTVRRLPSGEYVEVTAPVPIPHQPRLVPVEPSPQELERAGADGNGKNGHASAGSGLEKAGRGAVAAAALGAAGFFFGHRGDRGNGNGHDGASRQRDSEGAAQ